MNEFHSRETNDAQLDDDLGETQKIHLFDYTDRYHGNMLIEGPLEQVA